MCTQNLITRFVGMNWIGPDPFGGSLVVIGEEAEGNQFRFSTKYTDGETALVYYGYRYYTPQLGRWLSTDPIVEDAFWIEQNSDLADGYDNPDQAAYAAFLNNPTRHIDPLGLLTPCEEAKQKGWDRGDWGGIVCKDGKKHYCVWTPKNTNPGISYCVGQHELDHDDDTECPPSGCLRQLEWKKGKDPKEEECKAYRKEVDCLKKEKPFRCNKLQGPAKRKCQEDFDGVIRQRECNDIPTNCTTPKPKDCP